MSKKQAPVQPTVSIEDLHRYHGGGQVFPVTEDDLVFIIKEGKRKPTGYNHGRAWGAALKAATA